MNGQKCANCGYKMSSGESIFSSLGKLLGDIAERISSQNVTGTNTLSNATRLKCPKCGQTGSWIRDDE